MPFLDEDNIFKKVGGAATPSPYNPVALPLMTIIQVIEILNKVILQYDVAVRMNVQQKEIYYGHTGLQDQHFQEDLNCLSKNYCNEHPPLLLL